MSDNTLRSRFVHGAVWLASARASGQVITWVITVVVMRILSPDDYGLMAAAILVTGFLLLFSELGLGAAIVQRAELSEEEISDLQWVILGVNVVLFATLLALAPAVATYFSEPRLVGIVRILGLTFLFNGAGAPSAAILQREMAFKEKATAQFAGNVAGAVSTLVLAALGFGVWSLVFGSLAMRLVTSALYCVYRPPVFRRAFSMNNVGLFMNFGFQVATSRFLWFFSSRADALIVGRVLGAAPLGFYSLAFQFSSLPIEKLVTILNEIAFPSFSSVQDEGPRLQRHYIRLVSFVALVTFPMFVGLFLVADSAVAVLLGETWLPMVGPLQILCIASCFRAVETLHAPVALAKGQARVVVLNTLLASLVLPASFYAGARLGGISGVAVAWLATRPLLFTVVTLQTLRVIRLGFTTYIRALVHPVAGVIVMWAAVASVQTVVVGAGRPVLDLALSVPLGCVAYVGYHLTFNAGALQDLARMLPPGWSWPRPRSVIGMVPGKEGSVVASD